MRGRVVLAVGIAIAVAVAVAVAAAGWPLGAGDAGDAGAPAAVVETDPPAAAPRARDRAAVAPPPPAGPSSSARSRVLRLRVLRDEDRTPIAGARVAVTDRERREFVTDAEGAVDVRVVRGEVALDVLAEGRERRTMSVFARDEDRDVTIPLEREARVAGRVTDARTAEPLPGAEVVLRHGALIEGWYVPGNGEVGRTTTDAGGRFDVVGVSPDAFVTVRASAPGYAAAERGLQVSGPGPHDVGLRLARGRTIRGRVVGDRWPRTRIVCRVLGAHRSPFETERKATPTAAGAFAFEDVDADVVWYLRAADESGARETAEVEVDPAADDADVVLSVEPPSAVRLRVLQPDGTPYGPLAADTLWYRRRADGDGPALLVQNDAPEPFPLSPGTYAVRMYDADVAEVTLAPGETRDLELRAPEHGAFSGRVLDEQGDPLPGARIALGPPERPDVAFTEADGTFAVGPLRAGAWDVEIACEGHQRVRTAVELPSAPNDWRLPRRRLVRLVLPPQLAGLRVEARLFERSPRPDAPRPWSGLDHVARTYEADTLELPADSAADLQVRVGVQGFRTWTREIPGPLREDVELVVGDLAPAIPLRGRVLDSAGRPVPRAEVVLADALREPSETDANGCWTVDADPGRARLIVLAPSDKTRMRIQEARVDVVADARPLDITLRRDGWIDILCVDARGRPAGGRTVAVEGDPIAVGAPRTTDPRGRSTWRLLPGRHTLRVAGAAPVEVDVREDATTHVRVVAD